MSQDGMALVWSYLYVGAVVALGELAQRAGFSTEVSRKVVHVGVGLWIFGTLALFESPGMAAIPPVTAAMGNYVVHRRRLLKSISAEPDNFGTVYFPIAFAVLIMTAWDSPAAVAGGVMAMTIGDAAASLIGMRWGRHPYETLAGRRKSMEGSLTMLGATFLAVLGTLTIVDGMTGQAGRPEWLMTAASALAAVTATCAEALGVRGRDNLWVPLSTGAVLFLGLGPLPSEAVISLGLGALLAFGIGLAAWSRGSLTPSGVLGAVLTGTLVFGFGGWAAGMSLVGFFVSSSLLSRLFRSQKVVAEADYAKPGARDLGQTLANGGVAVLACLAFGLTRELRWLAAALGALAAANADTWATELGVLARTAPRLITTFRSVPLGTSGGVSWPGTLASLAGAAFVGVVAAFANGVWWAAVPALALAGLFGSLLDSLLGATLQGIYWCPTCNRETERRIHRCGMESVRRRGWPWLGNDLVNLIATLAGGALGFLLAG